MQIPSQQQLQRGELSKQLSLTRSIKTHRSINFSSSGDLAQTFSSQPRHQHQLRVRASENPLCEYIDYTNIFRPDQSEVSPIKPQKTYRLIVEKAEFFCKQNNSLLAENIRLNHQLRLLKETAGRKTIKDLNHRKENNRNHVPQFIKLRQETARMPVSQEQISNTRDRMRNVRSPDHSKQMVPLLRGCLTRREEGWRPTLRNQKSFYF